MGEDGTSRARRACVFLGGDAPDLPADYHGSVEDWQRFLHACGVSHFSAATLAAPRKDRRWHGMVPPTERLHHASAVLLAAERCRDVDNDPVMERWLYRPPAVNQAVGGARMSDHLLACAVDLDFQTEKHLTRVLQRVIWPLFGSMERWLEPSIGIGRKRLHLGLLAGKGPRFWRY